jgi:hypothetical protein
LLLLTSGPRPAGHASEGVCLLTGLRHAASTRG